MQAGCRIQAAGAQGNHAPSVRVPPLRYLIECPACMNINTVVLTHGELVNRLIVSALTDEGFPKRMNAITFKFKMNTISTGYG